MTLYGFLLLGAAYLTAVYGKRNIRALAGWNFLLLMGVAYVLELVLLIIAIQIFRGR